jgi:hypothetical protein
MAAVGDHNELEVTATSGRSPIKKIVSPTTGFRVQQTYLDHRARDDFTEAVVHRSAMPSGTGADSMSTGQWVGVALPTEAR